MSGCVTCRPHLQGCSWAHSLALGQPSLPLLQCCLFHLTENGCTGTSAPLSFQNYLPQCTLLLKSSSSRAVTTASSASLVPSAKFACRFSSLRGPTCCHTHACLYLGSPLPRRSPPTAKSCPVPETQLLSCHDFFC